jgi:hypothetical protein
MTWSADKKYRSDLVKNLNGWNTRYSLIFPSHPGTNEQSLLPGYVASLGKSLFTGEFGGSILLYEVIDAQRATRISASDLVGGKVTIPVSLDRAKRYRVDIVNNSHTKGCPCMRATHSVDPSILPAGDAGSISLKVTMDGIPDALTGLYPDVTVVPN